MSLPGILEAEFTTLLSHMGPQKVNVPFVASSCPLRESDPTIGSSTSRGFTLYVLVPRIRPATIRTYGFSAGRPPRLRLNRSGKRTLNAQRGRPPKRLLLT